MYLTNILQNLYSDLGQTAPENGIFFATGGSATTFINSAWGEFESPPETDTFKNMYLFVVNDATVAAGEDALQGKYSRISGYVDTTWTGTMATLTQLVVSGDTLMIAKQDKFPLAQMIYCVNRALQNLGDIALVYSSLTAGSDQTEYDVPVALKRKPPLAIKVQGQTGDSNDNQWLSVSNSDFEPAAPGSVGNLILPQLSSGNTIKLLYEGVHPTLTAYNDPVSETIHPSVVTAAAILEALTWHNNLDGNQGSDDYMTWLEGQYRNERLPLALAKFPIWKPKVQAKFFVAG